MDDVGTATLSAEGNGQVVHLPEGFALPGREARVRRVGETLVLEPAEFDVKAWRARLDAWWDEIDEFKDVPFMEDGRQQPPMPTDDEASFD